MNKNIEQLIREFSIEKDFHDNENFTEKNMRRMLNKLETEAVADSRELWGEEASEFAVFCLYLSEEEEECSKLIDKIVNLVPDNDDYPMYQIIVLTDTFSRKVTAQGWKTKIREKIKKKIKCRLSQIDYQTLSYCGVGRGMYYISVGGRLECLEIPGRDNRSEGAIIRKIDAYAYTADLYDIVTMYNEVGDSLFEHNVRYGIKDQLDVEESIKTTLRENPADFWYLNNGITITVQDPAAFDRKKAYRIGLDYSDPAKISVINGAQTIFAAAQFWYGHAENAGAAEDEETLRERAKAAKVLLRVMCVSDSGTDCQEEMDEISIALNRQKPIKSEDISYTHPVIMEINQLHQSKPTDDYYFRITKRGENVLGKYKYSLIEFARIVWAYRQEPGAARTKTANVLLKHEKDDPKSIYADEILENDTEEIFLKYYKPTNFAMRLFTYYGEFSKKTTKEFPNKQPILAYGRYYFVAYIIRVLYGENADYSDFSYSLNKISDGFNDHVENYLDILGRVSKEYQKENSEDNIESNTFKSDKLYQKLVRYGQNGKNVQLKKDIKILNEEIRKWFGAK